MRRKTVSRFCSVAFFAVASSILTADVGPVAVDFDPQKETCALCGMKVMSLKWAAEMITEEGPLFFDDIGCCMKYQTAAQAKSDFKALARYVRGYDGKSWLPIDTAILVFFKGIRTPMGYGIHAFPTMDAARAFLSANSGASIIDASRLGSIIAARGDGM